MPLTGTPPVRRLILPGQGVSDREPGLQMNFSGYPGSGYPLDRRSWEFL